MTTPNAPEVKMSKIIVYTLIVGAVSMLTYHLLVGETQLEGKETERLNTDSNSFKNYTINNDRDTILRINSGSVIQLSKGTFTDEKGNSIKGNVNLHYREFHNMAQTLLGNVPMEYDSAGKQYHFESAGMFEIHADANGETVKIQANKPIQVQLASLDKRSYKFNQYYLENRNGKWKYIGKDIPFAIAKMKPQREPLYVNKYTNANPKEANAITQLNPNKQQFNIEIPKDKFPELQGFTNLQFEVSSVNKKFDPTKTQQDWIDVEISKFGTGRDYKFTFIGVKENYEVIGYPVLDSLNFELATKQFEKINSTYQAKKEEKKNRQLEADAAWEKRNQNFDEATQKYRVSNGGTASKDSDSLVLSSMRSVLTPEAEEIVFRVFQVNNFGIYNSDCPENLPNDIIINATFKDIAGNAIKPQTIYLIQKGKNAVYKYYDALKLGFSPKAENVLLLIINNKLYHVKPEEFAEIKKGDKKHTFTTTLILKNKYNESDILALI